MSASDAAVVRPTDLRDAREAVRGGGRLVITGSGTAQDWGAPVGPVDTIVDTTGLDRIIAYNPADMTVAVGAGMRMSALQATLDEHGQRVSLDAARIADGATVGGLLATADAGPLRHVYGSLRDLVLGVTVVLADGTVARSGGHVVKNVAGYDLGKLLSGSLGTLGLIAEVVLRLHPKPQHSDGLAVSCDPDEGFRHATALVRSPLEPVTVEWCDGRLSAGFEGTAASVAKRLDKAGSLLADLAEVPSAAGHARLESSGHFGKFGRFGVDSEGVTVFRAGTVPSAFPELARHLELLGRDNGVRAELTSSLGVGVHTVRLTGRTPEAHADVLRSWRTRVVEAGGSVTLHRRIDGVDALVDSWGVPPASIEVFRALKGRLDPEHRLSPGRFAPWIVEAS